MVKIALFQSQTGIDPAANACARALRRAGAERVELVSWARVIKPMQLT